VRAEKGSHERKEIQQKLTDFGTCGSYASFKSQSVGLIEISMHQLFSCVQGDEFFYQRIAFPAPNNGVKALNVNWMHFRKAKQKITIR